MSSFGHASCRVPFFASDCLTVPVAGTYIAVTEGGSSVGVAGFVDFSANHGHDRGFGLGDWCRRFGFVGFGWFFDIVDGRKRSAGGGALRFGWFGAFGCLGCSDEGTLAVF